MAFFKHSNLFLDSFGEVDPCCDWPEGHGVFLDIDTKQPPTIPHIFARLRTVGLSALHVFYAPTLRGWHVGIFVREKLLPSEICALQAILGSDPARECLNLSRVYSLNRCETSAYWRLRWNVLFLEKVQPKSFYDALCNGVTVQKGER